jgi:hypothetical protein
MKSKKKKPVVKDSPSKTYLPVRILPEQIERIANTVTSKVSLADRREIRLMCALDDLPGIIKRLEANHKQGVRS